MEFKNPQEELERFRSRIAFAGGFVLFCFGLLFARFVWLQVIQHDYYQTRAEENRISLVPVVPNRGLIVDRNGVVLARNYSAYTLEITPSKVKNLEATIDELAKVLDVQPKDRKRFHKLLAESKNFESLPIRTRLSDEEVAVFSAHRYRFPGVDIKARLFRQYPFGAFASHLLGYIGRVTDRDIEKIEEREVEDNYRGTEHFGKTGLEQHYEFDLHGVTGFGLLLFLRPGLGHVGDPFQENDLGVVAGPQPQPDDPGIAAVAIGEPGGDLFEQLLQRDFVRHVARNQTLAVQRSVLRLGDQTIDIGTKRLCLRRRGRHLRVQEERRCQLSDGRVSPQGSQPGTRQTDGRDQRVGDGSHSSQNAFENGPCFCTFPSRREGRGQPHAAPLRFKFASIFCEILLCFAQKFERGACVVLCK